MNKKQLIVACLIISILFCGCNPYRFVKIDEGNELKPGYHIVRRDISLDELVIDKDGNYPQDLSLAKDRLKRRRKTVERWYKKYYPFAIKEHSFITSVKSFFFIFFLPLVWAVVAFHQPSEKGIEKESKKYRNAEEEMRRYIEEDTRKESTTK